MQHGQMHRPFGIEAEATLDPLAAQHGAAAGVFPEPAERQIRADAVPAQFGPFANPTNQPTGLSVCWREHPPADSSNNR